MSGRSESGRQHAFRTIAGHVSVLGAGLDAAEQHRFQFPSVVQQAFLTSVDNPRPGRREDEHTECGALDRSPSTDWYCS